MESLIRVWLIEFDDAQQLRERGKELGRRRERKEKEKWNSQEKEFSKSKIVSASDVTQTHPLTDLSVVTFGDVTSIFRQCLIIHMIMEHSQQWHMSDPIGIRYPFKSVKFLSLSSSSSSFSSTHNEHTHVNLSLSLILSLSLSYENSWLTRMWSRASYSWLKMCVYIKSLDDNCQKREKQREKRKREGYQKRVRQFESSKFNNNVKEKERKREGERETRFWISWVDHNKTSQISSFCGRGNFSHGGDPFDMLHTWHTLLLPLSDTSILLTVSHQNITAHSLSCSLTLIVPWVTHLLRSVWCHS